MITRTTVWLVLICGVTLGLIAGSAQLARLHAAATLVVDDDLACPSAAFSTIGAAIAAASSGDTIQVCAGTYVENVTINKSLTIVGVDPGPLPNPQALLTPGVLTTVISAASAADPIFDVTADFTILHIANIRAIGHTGAGVMRLAIAGSSSDLALDKVAFDGGARQVYFTGPAVVAGVSVTNSAFRCSAATASGLELWATQSSLTVTNNYLTGCRDGMNLSNVGGVTAPVTGVSLVSGNVIESVGDSGIQVAIAFEDLTISENVVRDADLESPSLGEGIQIETGSQASSFTIINNLIENGDHGLVFSNIAGADAHITASGNLITGNVIGVIIRGAVTTANVANIHVNDNCIETNTTGASNSIVATLDAEDNWWGDASGPFNLAANPGGTGDPVGSDIDFQPFRTSSPGCGPLFTRGVQCGIQAASEPAAYTFFSGADLVTINVTDDGSDLDCLRVTNVPTDHPNADPPEMTGEYWTIDALRSDIKTTATADYSVDLTLPFATADALDEVCRYTGSGWDCAATSFVANTSITRDGISELSDWAVANGEPEATPTPTPSATALAGTSTATPTSVGAATATQPPTAALLIYFTAAVDPRGQVVLAWETASEVDVVGFRVERATADGPWSLITPPIAARGGAAAGADYRWIDAPPPGMQRYRLLVLLADGTTQFFGPREAMVNVARIFLPIAAP